MSLWLATAAPRCVTESQQRLFYVRLLALKCRLVLIKAEFSSYWLVSPAAAVVYRLEQLLLPPLNHESASCTSCLLMPR